MFKNYLKIALRYLMRYKTYTAINVLGLAVGITCCILIMIFVRSEFSYDRFHSKSNRIYRVWQDEKFQGQEFKNTVTAIPMGPAMQSTFPEVESMCRVFAFNTLINVNNNSFNENITMVDSTIFRIFDFGLLQGSVTNSFPTSNAVIITPSISKKYFGDVNPIGKTFDMQLGDQKQLFTIAGVAYRTPEESSIKYDILIPFTNAKLIFREKTLHSWFNVFNETYVLLRNGMQSADLEKKFQPMLKQQLGEDYGTEEFNMYLQPLTAIHLDNSLPAGIQPISNPKYSYILATIGILILLVACINFITLSVGRSTTRALEVGVRKAMGAERKQLIRQFWGEALLVTMISVIIGLLAGVALLGPFNQLINRHLVFHVDLLFITFCALLAAIVALIAGIYPAVILSGFNPIEVLKGKLKMKDAGLFRKGLIVSQFVASIVMIICTLVIRNQMNYLQRKDLGYKKDQVIIVPTNKRRIEGYPLARLYKTELSKYPEVSSACVSVFSFAETPWITFGFSDDKKNYHSFQYNEIDASFIQTMQIPILQGRSFGAENASDTNNSILVNETLVKEYGIKDPIGKRFGKYSQQIIGVAKDFNYESLHTKIKPLVMSLKFDTMTRQSSDVSFANSPQPRISVRIKGGNIQDNINILKKAWQAVAPNQDFEYHFLDERLAAAYEEEQKSATVVKIASGLSIFIACMGLFGLATLTVTRRTKEIGIRKVLGANALQLVRLLSKDFVLLVLVASLIAFPIAWWATQKWLSDFAYRTSITWWVFALAAIASVIVALVTISTQSIKAAMMNPVESLRME
ncbi:MAG: FtsX-like permease family protein [Bacteroidetes bacterium]|nr:MAG: FtsX-like permease family protein [Bacteroidota bacterium]